MIVKRNDFCRRIVKLHFWSTVCGVICLIPSYLAALSFFTVGANSLYVTFCYGAFDEYVPLAKFSAWWFVLFPIAYFVSYIIAKRKRFYIPFLTLICADTLFVVFAAVYEYSRNNLYGVNLILADVLISIVYSAVAVIAVVKYRMELRKQSIVTD